ncbi:MAG: hypothetical protein ACRD9L_04280 [Bryobacteraceae bacterium]
MGRNQWDLILLFYMHGYLHSTTLDYPATIWDALKAGGLPAMDGVAGGRTGFQTNKLTARYSRLRILFYQDTVTTSDWMWSTSGGNRIIRLIAEKPPAEPSDGECRRHGVQFAQSTRSARMASEDGRARPPL